MVPRLARVCGESGGSEMSQHLGKNCRAESEISECCPTTPLSGLLKILVRETFVTRSAIGASILNVVSIGRKQ